MASIKPAEATRTAAPAREARKNEGDAVKERAAQRNQDARDATAEKEQREQAEQRRELAEA